MKAIIAVAALALLAGCASIGELRGGEPYATLHTTKAPQAVAECIRDAWQNQKMGLQATGATIQRTGDVVTVIASMGGPPLEVADIATDGTIKIYGQKDMDFGSHVKKRTQAATPCM